MNDILNKSLECSSTGLGDEDGWNEVQGEQKEEENGL